MGLFRSTALFIRSAGIWPILFWIGLGSPSLGLSADPGVIGHLEFPPEQAPSSTVQVRNLRGTRNLGDQGEIYLDDHVITGADQSVTLKLDDQSELILGPSTDLSLSQFIQSQQDHSALLNLDRGIVHGIVTPGIYGPNRPFRLRTQSAVMGVRGTEFLVEHDQGQLSTIHTLEGSVAIGKTEADLDRPETSVFLPAGQMSSLRPGMDRAEAPRSFKTEELFIALRSRFAGFARHIELRRARWRQRIERSGSTRNIRKRRQPRRREHE